MTENKIQLIAYRETMDEHKRQLYFKQVRLSVEAKSIVSLFANIEKIIEKVDVNERYNLHYTVANCKEQLREFAYQEALIFDIDGIDKTLIPDYIEVFYKTFPQFDINKCSIVSSGHGLHFIIAVKEMIKSLPDLHRTKPKYQFLVGTLAQSLFEAGLKGTVDDATWTNKKTMRLPLTINRKKNMEDVECTLIRNTLAYQEFDIDSIDVADATIPEARESKLYEVDVEAVLTGCKFLSYCKEEPNKVKETQWRYMLSNLDRIPNIGRTLCHEYSKGYKNYDYDETERKVESMIGLTGPHTCETISGAFSGCQTCPHFKKLNNPLQIKSKVSETIATESTGFWTVKHDSKGVPKPHKPCYVDLVKKFDVLHPFVTHSRTSDVYRFVKTHWNPVYVAQLKAFATDHFKPTADNKMRSEFVGLITSSNVVPSEFFEHNNYGKLNLSNGVLDIKTKHLTPHSTDHGFTHVLPYQYNPNATCPRFEKLLDDVTLGDKELQSVLLEYIGYIISGIDPAWGSKALILVGEGANGKSTFIEILRRLVGHGNYSSTPVKQFGDPNSVHTMVNKLLNVCEEEAYDSLRDSTAFKNIVSGGVTTVKQLYKDKYDTKVMCKIVVGCNAIPPTNDQSNATYRRMLIIPFNAVFNADKKNLNKNIVAEVSEELSGILNLVILHFEKLMERNGEFTTARSSLDALDRYRQDSDTIGTFLAETYVMDPQGKLYTKDILSDFAEWRRLNNVRVDYDSRALGRRMDKVFASCDKGRDGMGRFWTGIRKATATEIF